jgi:cytoskeletal protein CcmA (bactofilin family)
VFKFLKTDGEPAMADLQQAATNSTGTPVPPDNGLDMPPFRPAAPPDTTPANPFGRTGSTITKEQPMARSIFGAAPPTPTAPTPTAPTPTSATASIGNPPIPATPMAPRTPQPALSRSARDAAAEKRTLVVGRGISVQGSVTDAERLVVEGQVEASMIHAHELAVTQGGIFRGEVEVEDAEIAGTVDGTLTVKGNLIVRHSGILLGTARCRRLQVEDGGQITGRVEMITDSRPRTPVVPGEP